MSKRLAIRMCVVFSLATAGCAGLDPSTGIMREDPGDPAGSASIGTGSVTTNSTISSEAKAAGIGLGT